MSLLFILLSSCLSILVSSNKCHNLYSGMQEKPAFNEYKSSLKIGVWSREAVSVVVL